MAAAAAVEAAIEQLGTSGFCAAPGAVGGELLGKALKDAADVDAAGKLQRPPELLVEGLLGERGSSRIAVLAGPGGEVAAGLFGDGLQELDESLTEVATLVGSYGFDCRGRTQAVLHESGPVSGLAPALTEEEASTWMFRFSRALMMCVILLGPDGGNLELRPHDPEGEAQAHLLQLTPGSIVLLRSDIFAAQYAGAGRGLLLTCFLLAGAARREKHKFGQVATPCVQRLSEWSLERLEKLKEVEVEDRRLDVPRDWIRAMNHQYFKGQHMAVRGLAMRMPVTWDEHCFYAASFHGPDYMVEVPIRRWDLSQRYEDDPEAWKVNRSFTRHMGLVEGAEYFDHKMFSLNIMEAKTMDPHQRVVLENGYEALVKGGYKRGQIMNSTGGMYLGFGTSTSDNGYMERVVDASAEGSFGATGGASAICANRFSFCLGMRGPSMVIDAEDASSTVALHQGCEGLQRRGRLTANFFSLVGGVKLNISPYFWPMKQAMGIMSRRGRCLSFDASADGMVMADNATNLVLNALTEVVDNQVVVKEFDQFVGVVAGSSTNHNGRSAHFNAPNGPAEQEVISMAIRGAGLSGFDIDASECYATGGFLADAVEVSSTMRVLRLADQCEDPLGLTSLKSSTGNSSWASGAASFARILLGNHWGCMTPNLHLSRINPHIDAWEQPMCFVTEAVEFKMGSSYVHTMSRGFGGTNAAAVAFGSMDPEKCPPPPPPSNRESLAFWPPGWQAVEGGDSCLAAAAEGEGEA